MANTKEDKMTEQQGVRVLYVREGYSPEKFEAFSEEYKMKFERVVHADDFDAMKSRAEVAEAERDAANKSAFQLASELSASESANRELREEHNKFVHSNLESLEKERQARIAAETKLAELLKVMEHDNGACKVLEARLEKARHLFEIKTHIENRGEYDEHISTIGIDKEMDRYDAELSAINAESLEAAK